MTYPSCFGERRSSDGEHALRHFLNTILQGSSCSRRIREFISTCTCLWFIIYPGFQAKTIYILPNLPPLHIFSCSAILHFSNPAICNAWQSAIYEVDFSYIDTNGTAGDFQFCKLFSDVECYRSRSTRYFFLYLSSVGDDEDDERLLLSPGKLAIRSPSRGTRPGVTSISDESLTNPCFKCLREEPPLSAGEITLHFRFGTCFCCYFVVGYSAQLYKNVCAQGHEVARIPVD